MKCPYITKSVSIEVAPSENELSKAMVIEYPTECMGCECAAFQNNRCVRN